MLKAEHLTFSYHKKNVLTDVSFQADTGEIIGLIGRNGCGKSTLLTILSGSLKSSGGSVTLDGEPLLDKKNHLSGVIGFVPQRNPILPELNVRDNLSLWRTPKADREPSHNQELFDLLQLTELMDVPLKRLSEGMKKRVSIASVLQNRPSVLLLDEPTAALDLPCKELIHSALLDFTAKGGIVLLTTHEEPDFLLCKRLYLLKNGILSLTNPTLSKNQLIQQM